MLSFNTGDINVKQYRLGKQAIPVEIHAPDMNDIPVGIHTFYTEGYVSCRQYRECRRTSNTSSSTNML